MPVRQVRSRRATEMSLSDHLFDTSIENLEVFASAAMECAYRGAPHAAVLFEDLRPAVVCYDDMSSRG
jgi:hypothetical protein